MVWLVSEIVIAFVSVNSAVVAMSIENYILWVICYADSDREYTC
jgi:hypothetical protein